jgi:hypothetical protein
MQPQHVTAITVICILFRIQAGWLIVLLQWRSDITQPSIIGCEKLIINGNLTGITILFTFMCIQLNYYVSPKSVVPCHVYTKNGSGNIHMTLQCDIAGHEPVDTSLFCKVTARVHENVIIFAVIYSLCCNDLKTRGHFHQQNLTPVQRVLNFQIMFKRLHYLRGLGVCGRVREWKHKSILYGLGGSELSTWCGCPLVPTRCETEWAPKEVRNKKKKGSFSGNETRILRLSVQYPAHNTGGNYHS